MTKNETQKPDDATLIIKRVLQVPPDLAYRAWTTPEHIQQWMRPNPEAEVPQAKMDLRVGGKFRIQMKMPDGEFFTAVGEFREIEAPKRLVYTWDWEKDGRGPDFGEPEGKTSLITVEFNQCGAGTELVMTHSRFATVESRDNHARGWNDIVDAYVAVVEKKLTADQE